MLKKLLLVTFVTIFFILNESSVYASFGVSPADLTYEHLLPGMKFEKEFLLSRTNLEKDLNILVETDIGGMNDWIEIEPSVAFIIPKGQRTRKMKVIINVPNDASLKTYKGYITLKTALDEDTSGVTVAGGVGISVKLTVGVDEISQLLVRNIEIPNLYEGRPILMFLNLENQGNTEAAPERITLTLSDIHGNNVLNTERSDLEKIEPGKQEEFVVDFENTLKEGNYTADVEIMFDKDIIREEKLAFSVKEEIEKDQEKSFIFSFMKNNLLLFTGAVFLLVPLIIALRKLLKDKIF